MIALNMSSPNEGAVRYRPGPKAGWTLVGASAIPMWALWPLFAAVISDSMPLFQFSTINYGIGALTLFAMRASRSVSGGNLINPSISRSAWLSAILFAVMSLFSGILFLLALRFVPPAQANLIVYLWPVEIIVIGTLVRLIKPRLRDILSVALALAGAALVIGPDLTDASLAGVALAAASGLLWAAFCVFRAWQGPDAPDAVTGGVALSAIAAAVIHFATETTVIPPALPLILAILTGMVPLAIANLAWDNGFRRGDRVTLAIAAYATPLVSAAMLMAFGFAEPTAGLLAGGILIVLGGITSARR